MSTNLIINADDFGLCRGTNYGVLESMKNGIVTSASLMTTTPYFDHAIEILESNPKFDIGIHLSLTCGKPICSDLTDLLNEDGIMVQDYKKLSTIPKKDINRELEAQIEKLLSRGIKPSHMDFHHTPCIIPNVFDVASSMSLKYGIPMRGYSEIEVKRTLFSKVRYYSCYDIDFFEDNLESVDSFKKLLLENKDKDFIEIMVHPSFLDDYLLNNSKYNSRRLTELNILTSNEIKDFLVNNDFSLLNYRGF